MFNRFNTIYKLLKLSKKEPDISGPVMAIGGAEDKTTHGKILQKFFELAGGKGCDITIVPWASDKPKRGKLYQKIFKSLGAKEVVLLDPKDREKALEAFDKSAAIFFVGGDHKKLLDILERLDLIKPIQNSNKGGALVGGTSAGASILSEHMPYWNDEEGKLHWYRGLALVPDSIIDQHYSQRHRVKRLEESVKRFEGSIGYGIDEDTAIIFEHNKEPVIIGSGKVTIMK